MKMEYADGLETLGKVEKCFIITGLSGAGKTTVLNIFEDQGFFAIDNLPPALMPELMEVLSRNKSAVFSGVAIVVDVRGEELLNDLFFAIDTLKRNVLEVRMLFMEASDDWIIRRYETTRRHHPLGKGVTLLESVAKERQQLKRIRSKSDIILDTSSLLPNDLRGKILSALDMNEDPLSVIISSFGFKNGVPRDCDYLFDVRFLPNPNYVPELKKLSGQNIEIQNYLEKVPEKRIFIERLEALLEFILMQYERTGKKQVHIAIGCTGGRHRSVAIAEQLGLYFSDRGHRMTVNHRDIDKETD